MRKLRHVLLLFSLCFSWTAHPAFAAINIQEIFPLATAGYSLGDYITPLLSFSIIGAGLIAFLLFIGGGITMIASSGNPQDQQKGKNAVTAGVMGLVLVVSAYWITQILEVLTGIDLLNPGI